MLGQFVITTSNRIGGQRQNFDVLEGLLEQILPLLNFQIIMLIIIILARIV